MNKKIRLIGKGWEHFNGNIGVTVFKDGLSVGPVHQMDAHRLTCTIGARWEDGSASSVGEGYEASKNKPAPTVEEQVAQDAAAAAAAKGPEKTYTEAELGAIVDANGIAGLREIAAPLNVKGNSIKALVDGILKVAGASDTAEVAKAEETAEEGEKA